MGVGDHPIGVDQERVPVGVVGEGVIGGSKYPVGRADRGINIAEQREREVVVGLERLVLLWGVERDAENGATSLGELLSLITQALSLEGSTGGGGLGVPPQQHPAAAKGG